MFVFITTYCLFIEFKYENSIKKLQTLNSNTPNKIYIYGWSIICGGGELNEWAWAAVSLSGYNP